MTDPLTIRFMTESDLPAGAEILEKAFGGSNDRLAELHRYRRIQFEGWFFALWDGIPAGMVLSTDYGPFAHIGMMGVHPDFQRKGIARALMLTLLDWLDRRGCPLATLDASQMGKPLYDQLGFIACDLTVACMLQERKDSHLSDVPVAPIRAEDLPALAAFDALAFGADRRAVLETFWQDYPARSYLIRNGSGEIAGYLIAQRQKIGPWVAVHPEAAIALLAAALKLPFEDAPTVLAPQANADAVALLGRSGFIPSRALPHMIRPLAALPGRRDQVYSETNFGLG